MYTIDDLLSNEHGNNFLLRIRLPAHEFTRQGEKGFVKLLMTKSYYILTTIITQPANTNLYNVHQTWTKLVQHAGAGWENMS